MKIVTETDPMDALLAAAMDVNDNHATDDFGRCVKCEDGTAEERCLPYRTASLVLGMWDDISYLRVAG